MNHQKISFNLDLRIMCAALALIILGLVLWSQPWGSNQDTRKISITGQAEIKAVPDEFIFSPIFERTGTDTAKMKQELSVFGKELMGKLKEMGVQEQDIKLNSNSYENYLGRPTSSESQVVSLAVSITVPSKELAQKVQDYLASTDAKGQLTAQGVFSDTKRKELENQARDKAIEDARSKANRTARNVDASVGKVIEVKEMGGSGVTPFMARESAPKIATDTALPVTPGQETVSLSVEVVFELR